MKLNTIRMIDNDQQSEILYGSPESMKEKLAYGLINPADFDKLNLVKSLKLHLKNEYGEVNIRFLQSEDVPKGIILMPVSIWSNQLTGVKQGEILYKNILVEVEATRDDPPSFEDLIKKISNKKIKVK
ncbi:MAG: molybdopterin dinucleotide binding domain-containing protein [Candidatus Lokiarchaeota archaeon]